MPEPTDHGSQPEQHDESEPAQPLNRAERRAQRRGKKLPQAQAGGHGPIANNRAPVVLPRRSGRRGNR